MASDLVYLLGTDEAGYGPNLGPLVVTATVWQGPARAADADLYELLAPHVTRERPVDGASTALWLADSKSLYSPAEGLAALERGVLALLGAMGHAPRNRAELCRALGLHEAFGDGSSPWHCGEGDRLPVAASAAEIAERGAGLRAALDARGVRLLAVRPRVVSPERFNGLLDELGNKASALSSVTLGLAAELLSELPPAPAEIICDKHGGRNYYAGLLQTHFDQGLIHVERESQAASAYRWGDGARRRTARFEVGAERHLPVAAASMCSKYLRELAMREFNEFWARRVPGLRPTAGYPVDAKRFRAEIAAAQRQLAIRDAVLWRAK